MLLTGIAQLFLTLTNVMIATISMVKDLFPEKEGDIDINLRKVRKILIH